jgi:hypothetical protein
MKKVKHYLISILPVLLAAIIAYFLYNAISSTPVLILILFILFISIIWSIGLFKRSTPKGEDLIELEAPELEEGLIYITPFDFATKSEPTEGKLFIAGSSYNQSAFSYTNATYKKLTDELTISFQPQLDLVISGINTIGVGDYQFCLFGFSKMEIKKGNKTSYTYTWGEHYLTIEDGKAIKNVTLRDGDPTLIFEWYNSIIGFE